MEDVDQLVVVTENIICPVELEPPVKRRRGRPKKVPGIVSAELPDPETEAKVKPTPDMPVETNRVAGGMSLRPNRRVDVRKGKNICLVVFEVRDKSEATKTFLGPLRLSVCLSFHLC
jgi:hypothetical protein